MRGDQVIVRDWLNRPLVRKVWSIGKGRIFVTNDLVYKELAEGRTELMPIGFPVEDVFRYDADAARDIESGVDWSKLMCYQ